MKTITKDNFVALLTEIGVTEAQRKQMHSLFEQRHPEAHQAFLEYLGIQAAEIAKIRTWSLSK